MLVCIGVRKNVSTGPLVDFSKSFSRGAKLGEICFITPETKKIAFFAEICEFLPPSDQARNQFGTPGEAKNFMKGAHIF